MDSAKPVSTNIQEQIRSAWVESPPWMPTLHGSKQIATTSRILGCMISHMISLYDAYFILVMIFCTLSFMVFDVIFHENQSITHTHTDFTSNLKRLWIHALIKRLYWCIYWLFTFFPYNIEHDIIIHILWQWQQAWCQREK